LRAFEFFEDEALDTGFRRDDECGRGLWWVSIIREWYQQVRPRQRSGIRA
jgi:hypothetical protein